MRYAQKLICILLLVLAASFGAGGCYLLYSDFSAQVSRAESAGADVHEQTCTMLQAEILEMQRNGTELTADTLSERVRAQGGPAALWRGGTLVDSTLPATPDTAPADGIVRIMRVGQRYYALYGSSLQGSVQAATAYDLTALYRDRSAALRRFLLLEAVVLAAGAFVISRLAARLTYPLTVLSAASARIAGGDYARRTDLHTGDELEDVSRSFDKMADAVQDKIDDLEQEIVKREEFVGAFTHELKTPMTGIIGYADLLRTVQGDPGEQREAVTAIYREGRRVEALSQKLLALLALSDAKPDTGPLHLTALWPRLRMACPQVNLQLPAGEPPVVYGDADLILDWLCNLVHNAVKASAPGAPIRVLWQTLPDGSAVRLTVADQGCGIPADKLSRVTEPFYMVDKSRARRQGGSGLGLALCKRIAAAHGSELTIQSRVGVGTQVSMLLPTAPPPKPPEEPEEPENSAAPEIPAPQKGGATA